MRPADPANRKRQVAKIRRNARRLFARDGYDRVSMDRGAAACGLTKPVLCYYFENKRAVPVAMLGPATRKGEIPASSGSPSGSCSGHRAPTPILLPAKNERLG